MPITGRSGDAESEAGGVHGGGPQRLDGHLLERPRAVGHAAERHHGLALARQRSVRPDQQLTHPRARLAAAGDTGLHDSVAVRDYPQLTVTAR
jgi:hypothetical protein